MGAPTPGPGGSATPTPSPRDDKDAAAAPGRACPATALRAFLDAAAERAAACAALEAAFTPFLHGAAGGEGRYRTACESAGRVVRGSAGAAPAAVDALTAAGFPDLAATVGAVAADEAHRTRMAIALHALRKAGADAEKGAGSVAVEHGGGCGCGPGATAPPPPPPSDAGLEAARDAADRGAAITEATAELEAVAERINDGLSELREALLAEDGALGGGGGGGG